MDLGRRGETSLKGRRRTRAHAQSPAAMKFYVQPFQDDKTPDMNTNIKGHKRSLIQIIMKAHNRNPSKDHRRSPSSHRFGHIETTSKDHGRSPNSKL